jgi:type 1 glutamine amidotransferase
MKKIIFVYGGWEGHQPKETTEIFAKIMEKEGYDIEMECARLWVIYKKFDRF